MYANLQTCRASGNLLVAAYALLATGLWLRNGHYAPTAFALVAASFACTLIAFTRKRDGNEPARPLLLAVLGVLPGGQTPSRITSDLSLCPVVRAGLPDFLRQSAAPGRDRLSPGPSITAGRHGGCYSPRL